MRCLIGSEIVSGLLIFVSIVKRKVVRVIELEGCYVESLGEVGDVSRSDEFVVIEILYERGVDYVCLVGVVFKWIGYRGFMFDI